MRKEVALFRCIASLLIVLSAVSCRNPRQRFDVDWRTGNPWNCHVDKYDSLEQFSLSPDGQTISYLAKAGGEWQFIRSEYNGLHVNPSARIIRNGLDTNESVLTLSPDSLRISVVYKRESHWRDNGPRPVREDSNASGQWFVDIDHHIFGGFDRDFKPTVRFSTDGKKFAFPYKKLGQYYVQVVDTTFGPYDRADVTITNEGGIVLGYIKQDRAYIENIFNPQDNH